MKSDKTTKAGAKENKAAAGTGKKTNATKSRSVGTDQTNPATASAKARAGGGLANEGTIVSYDEER